MNHGLVYTQNLPSQQPAQQMEHQLLFVQEKDLAFPFVLGKIGQAVTQRIAGSEVLPPIAQADQFRIHTVQLPQGL